MSPTPGRTSDGPGRRSFGVDGSLRDDLFGDAFASSGDAFAESRLVFLEGNRLPERFRELAESALPSFSVAEIGFGTGANFALCAELFFRLCPDRTLEYEGLEGYPLSPGELRAAHARWPGELKPWAEALQKTWDEGKDELAFRNARLHLRFGLFADVLPALERKADAWILDGFAPSKNPDAWSDALFAQIARLSAPGATAATFTVAGDVRRRLLRAGFDVEKRPGFGRKRSRLEARLARPAGEVAPGAVPGTSAGECKKALRHALEQAVRSGDESRARSLLGEPGAKPDGGLLFLALRSPAPVGLLSLLLARGCPPDARNAKGSTALIEAIRAGLPEAEELLLANGADPGLPDGRGRTPETWRALVRNGTRKR